MLQKPKLRPGLRKVPRVACRLPGMIVDGGSRFPCTVLDMSVVGCRVRIQHRVYLSDQFEFVFVRKNIRVKARLVWQEENEVGLQFIHERNSASLPAD